MAKEKVTRRHGSSITFLLFLQLLKLGSDINALKTRTFLMKFRYR